ncbi:MAG: CRISPR-associated endonuclease Cas1 [Thermovirgaceae bacterium]
MPNQVFLVKNVRIRRRKNTLEIEDTGSENRTLIPILQLSEIFALQSAECEDPALALLSEKAVPLHLFEDGNYKGSWMPFSSILSGQVSVAQYMVLFDADLRIQIAQEIIRGGCRLRSAVSRKWFKGNSESWESKYLDVLSGVYANPGKNMSKVLQTIRELDLLRRKEYENRKGIDFPTEKLRLAEGLAKASILGAFTGLSLDPLVNILREETASFMSLCDDFFFLFEPLFVDLWLPEFSQWSGKIDQISECYRNHFTRICARDGKRAWSLRTLPLREGYALISHFMGRTRYRAARKVEVPSFAGT